MYRFWCPDRDRTLLPDMRVLWHVVRRAVSASPRDSAIDSRPVLTQGLIHRGDMPPEGVRLPTYGGNYRDRALSVESFVG
jgi:hypothetical protein